MHRGAALFCLHAACSGTPHGSVARVLLIAAFHSVNRRATSIRSLPEAAEAPTTRPRSPSGFDGRLVVG